MCYVYITVCRDGFEKFFFRDFNFNFYGIPFKF